MENGEIMSEATQEELHQRMETIRDLTGENEQLREQVRLMKYALNRRPEQAVKQLREAFTTIFRLAGKSEHDPLTYEQEATLAIFASLIKKVPTEENWDKNSPVNKYTSWNYIW